MERSKILIGLLVILALLYILYKSSQCTVENEGEVSMNQEQTGSMGPQGAMSGGAPIPSGSAGGSGAGASTGTPSSTRPAKATKPAFVQNKNTASRPKKLKATTNPDGDTWSDFFNEYNNVIESGQKSSNSEFRPYDETNDAYANFQAKKYVKGPPFVDERKREDSSFDPELYNAENLLPQEKHPDWFEVIEEPISVKNRHLISLQQPIGINTIGQSLKNATRDLRAAPANPKMVVGPWLQSTIEPDYNTKSLC